MILTFQTITKQDIKSNPWVTFIYNDDDTRSALGGKSAASCEFTNTIGIRVKKAPHKGDDAYYTDKEVILNIRNIREDLEEIKELLQAGNIIIFPQGGIGEGLTQLRTRAPKTYAYLHNELVCLHKQYCPQRVLKGMAVKAFDSSLFKVTPITPETEQVDVAVNIFRKATGITPKQLSRHKMGNMLRKIYIELQHVGMDHPF